MFLERTPELVGIQPCRSRVPTDLAASWRGLAQWAAAGSALFLTVFLVISLVALHRARAQDIPETVRALAHLLHPRARPHITSNPTADRCPDDTDESR